MLSAAEAAMDQAAEDDAERQRNRARLYAPPPGTRREARRRPTQGVSLAQAQSLMAQVAAEDARFNGGRTG
ncbi:hypothetical protein ACWCQE_26770 [Streptomyces sp. NPDC002409]